MEGSQDVRLPRYRARHHQCCIHNRVVSDPMYRKSNVRPTGRLVYRANRYSRFSPSLFHATLIARPWKMHQRILPQNRQQPRDSTASRRRRNVDARKKSIRADVDKYRRDKLPCLSEKHKECSRCTSGNLIFCVLITTGTSLFSLLSQ